MMLLQRASQLKKKPNKTHQSQLSVSRSGEKGPSKAGSGCPFSTLEVDLMSKDGDTNTQPKVQVFFVRPFIIFLSYVPCYDCVLFHNILQNNRLEFSMFIILCRSLFLLLAKLVGCIILTSFLSLFSFKT